MIKKGYLCLLLILLLVPVPARATEPRGSIRLVMQCQGSSVSGGTVTVYHITDLDISEGPEVMAQRLQDMGITGETAAVGSDGTVLFSNMECGNYLLVQRTAASDYLCMKPFCVTIPMRVGEKMEYHIEAFPKLERVPDAQLPQTGQLLLPVWGLFLGGLVLTVFGLLLQKRK